MEHNIDFISFICGVIMGGIVSIAAIISANYIRGNLK